MFVGRLPIATAQLAGICCEGVLYGLYLLTCWFCARTLLLTDGTQGVRLVKLHEVRWLLASVSMIFFIISTWDMATGVLHLFNAFIKAEDPTEEFNKPADWINIARALNQSLIMLLSDFVLMYRCWIVYERRWLVIAPSLILYFGAMAMTIRVMKIVIAPWGDEYVALDFCPWMTIMFGINTVQNIVTTGTLVWRIWQIGRQIDKNTNYPGARKDAPPRPMQKVMRAIIESGAVYTATVFAAFLTSRSNAIFITADMSLQTAGIVFNVIIVRSIERNSRVGVADPESGRVTPIFRHAARDVLTE